MEHLVIEHQDTRDYIDVLYPSKKKRAAEGTAITTEPINKDSENKRIWLFERELLMSSLE